MYRITMTIAAALLVAASANGQNARNANRNAGLVPPTEGFMLGAHVVAASGITVQGPGMRGQIKTNLGSGAAVHVGYGFTPQLLAFMTADVSKQSTTYAGIDGDFGLVHVEFGARYAFNSPGKRTVPYIHALAGRQGMAASSDDGGISATLSFTGTELGVGGGILYALSPRLSLDAGATAVRGKFDKVELTGDVESKGTVNVDPSNSLRLRIGVSWHPSSRTPRT